MHKGRHPGCKACKNFLSTSPAFWSPRSLRHFQEGNLFSSYHGMIMALVHNQASADTNSLVFEIALQQQHFEGLHRASRAACS